MGTLESKPSTTSSSSSPQKTTSSDLTHQAQDDDKFRDEVRKSAENFKNLVINNKVMIFSATYCSYCTVAKVIKTF